MSEIQMLDRLLKKAKSYERPNILQGIYKQLTISHQGKKAGGQLRNLTETDSVEGHDFAWYVAEQLDIYGLHNHAQRLRHQYSGVPRKPQKSWTGLPNLVGDTERVEELVNSGDAGRDIAGLGALFAALNKANEARRKPADPKFLYPTSRQFPFDGITYQIVKALEERDFNFPGIKVELHSYGPSDSYRLVKTIEGDDFRLWFCRAQGRVDDDWNDTAAVNELNIPKKELHVYEDNSGPTFYLYVGKNWERDKESFIHGSKVNSKLNHKPKSYLHYSGSWQKTDGGIHYPGKIAPFLAHDNDLEREYDPQGNEPRYFETQKVFQEFADFLKNKHRELFS
jgi:hypothetical protein